MSEDLRTMIVAVLKAQEKEAREARKKTISIGVLWTFVKPSNYESLVRLFLQKGMLKEFQDSLTESLKTKLWDNINNYDLAEILREKAPNSYAEIIPEMSCERLEQFVNSSYCDYKMLLATTDDSTRVEILKMLSLKKLEVVMGLCPEWICNFLKKICVENIDKEDRAEIFKKFALLPPEKIARLLEKVEPCVIHNILREMEAEDIFVTCREIQAEELYRVLEKSNYSILNYARRFPYDNLSKEQRQSIFQYLRQAEIRADVADIIHSFYPVVCLADKEYILYHVLAKDELITLYETLSEADQQEMLLIMIGEKSDVHQGVVRKEEMYENAIFVLEKKGSELSYIENLVLNDLKSDLNLDLKVD